MRTVVEMVVLIVDDQAQWWLSLCWDGVGHQSFEVGLRDRSPNKHHWKLVL